MKILHVGKYFPPYLGGMETVLDNQVHGLLSAGHQVSVIVAGQQPQDRHECIHWSGKDAALLRLANLGVIFSQPVTPGLFAALRREIQVGRPDVVHLHLPNPLLALAWWFMVARFGRNNLPPCVVWYHADITRQKWGKHLAAPLIRWCLGQASAICVSSRSLVEQSELLKPHEKDIQIIPFGIDPDPWQQVDSTFDGPFLFVGRLVPYKGLSTLIEAVTKTTSCQLVLAGEGPERDSLISQVSQAGLHDRVQLAGTLSQSELLHSMSQARALVLPSINASETFGLVQLEAMAAGLPVIASNLPTGIAEVGQPDKTCLLVEPGNASDLARALEQLQADPLQCKEMGQAGRERFLSRFSQARMIADLEVLYDQVSVRHRNGGRD